MIIDVGIAEALPRSASLYSNMKDAQLLRQFKGEVAVFLSYLTLIFITSTVLAQSLLPDFPALPGSPLSLLAYLSLTVMTIWSHAKCVLTNPGYVPLSPLATPLAESPLSFSATCSVCHCVKPPMTHHCKTCNRCVYRMDHHCPWVNNCIGYYSQKQFLLFLIYGEALGIFSLSELAAARSGEVMWWIAFALCAIALIFVTCVLWQQLVAIYFNRSGIDRLQQQFTPRVRPRQKPLIQNLNETFGESISLWWFLPVSLSSGPVIDRY